jgi:hypothetical protein
MALEESESVDWTHPDFDRVNWQVSVGLLIGPWQGQGNESAGSEKF